LGRKRRTGGAVKETGGNQEPSSSLGALAFWGVKSREKQ